MHGPHETGLILIRKQLINLVSVEYSVGKDEIYNPERILGLWEAYRVFGINRDAKNKYKSKLKQLLVTGLKKKGIKVLDNDHPFICMCIFTKSQLQKL